MADETKYAAPTSLKSLNVLPHSGKVDQLRAEVAANPKPINTTTLADRNNDATQSPAQKALREKVIEAIQTVYDPEIPVSIYELGLIYDIDIDADAKSVAVKMTLTAPGCPVAGSLPREVQQKLQAIPGVADASVELVWEPAWTKDRMSEAAMLELGLF